MTNIGVLSEKKLLPVKPQGKTPFKKPVPAKGCHSNPPSPSALPVLNLMSRRITSPVHRNEDGRSESIEERWTRVSVKPRGAPTVDA